MRYSQKISTAIHDTPYSASRAAFQRTIGCVMNRRTSWCATTGVSVWDTSTPPKKIDGGGPLRGGFQFWPFFRLYRRLPKVASLQRTGCSGNTVSRNCANSEYWRRNLDFKFSRMLPIGCAITCLFVCIIVHFSRWVIPGAAFPEDCD